MVEVVVTDEFLAWYRGLDESGADDVERSVEWLKNKGVNLGFPYCSAIKGATFPLRELRVQSDGRPFRVFYAFDPRRQAVLLVGGDKTGDDRFYDTMLIACERIWKEYLSETA